MKSRLYKFLGLLTLAAVAIVYMNWKEDLSLKAIKMNLTGNAQLRFSKTSYNLGFKKLSALDESAIDAELKKIHQIQEKISTTSISDNGEIMITLAKSIDQNVVLVIFKNHQIQMIQKVLNLSENSIEFQYGSLQFLPENLDHQKIAYSQNIELEF